MERQWRHYRERRLSQYGRQFIMNRGHIPPEFGQVGTPMTLSPPKCDDDLESAFLYAVLTDFSTAAKKLYEKQMRKF